MSSCSPTRSTENGCRNAVSADANLLKNNECSLEHEKDGEEDEDEEADVDFNPFLKETPSLEASSSLSSEIEGLDADVVDSGGNSRAPLVTTLLPKAPGELQDYFVGDIGHGEEIVMQTTLSAPGTCKISSEKIPPTGHKKRKSAVIYESDGTTFCEKEDGSSIATDVVNDVTVVEFSNTSHSTKLIMDIDDEDAICMRTRARYSLASFTLDELETFLQETDDEDDLQNIDDEEEYRKFLAAVLQGGDGNSGAVPENENVDEEDEDNDADFELEIEEALESDVDENIRGGTKELQYEPVGRRPETRQNKRQKDTLRHKRFSGQLNRPLRPLLPYAPIAPFPALDGRNLMFESAPHCLSSSTKNVSISVFTPKQIGRLHCLIYEHVQLLVQVFSLCVLEPSRQHIATQVQGLLSEMLHKRDQLLASRRVPYPSFCFSPPYIHPSVPDELPHIFPAQSTFKSSTVNEQRVCSSGKNMMPPSDANFPFEDRCLYNSSGKAGHLQSMEGFFWVSGPVLSVIDVAPLNLVESYMDDVSSAVRDYQWRNLAVTCDTSFEKECLFPFQILQSSTEVNDELLRASASPASKLVPSSASGQTPRKTIAAALVERSKKQSVAPVPKEIAKLAQRFFPLFNPDLFPHKPPPAAVANRVLFTDAEDGLLARGLMQYNTDWKEIQTHFLPCKSKHQIFVRQKNRSCSRAPENPIKAVRRIKNSPLTTEEKARIEEGLKVFKLNWMSVWKFVVPHRDPSLLARQWRTATGTQKSYKGDEDKKAKRRLYESMRRKSKPAGSARWESTCLAQNIHQPFRCKEGRSTEGEVDPVPHSPLPSGAPRWQTSSDKEECSTDNAGGENNSGDDCVDNEDEAYVHEAFLADWRPGTGISSEFPVSHFKENPPTKLFSQEGSCVWEQIRNSGSMNSQPQFGHEFPAVLKHSHHPHTSYQSTQSSHSASSIQFKRPVSDITLRSAESKLPLRPYRARRAENSRLVKLAPDLPPVNLPPSVRVMSQSAFRNYRDEASNNVSGANEGSSGSAKENIDRTSAANSGTSHPIKAGQDKRNPVGCGTSHLDPQLSAYLRDKCYAKEKDESVLHMHPLLFRPPDDGSLPYYPWNCSTGSYSSFNFFPKNHPQLNISLFHSPRQVKHTVNNNYLKSKRLSSSSFGIDFHPLLQRTGDANNDPITAHSVAQLSSNTESRALPVQLQNPIDVVLNSSLYNTHSIATHAMPSTLNSSTNELDLDIHLSFSARKDKGGDRRQVSEQNMTRSIVSAEESGIIETQVTSNSLNQHTDVSSTPTHGGIGNKLDSGDSGAHALIISGSDINKNNVNEIVDQSLPEIVMEQEELSDSEEEIGENVEFECEEMTDSEGEGGSDSDQIGNIPNEDGQDHSLEKVVIDAENDDQHEPMVHGNNGGPSKGSGKFGTTDPEKGDQSSSLCLRLSSYAPSPSLAKPKLPVTRNRRGSNLNRSFISTPQQQPHLDDVSVNPSRKPRKRAQKPDSGLSTGRARKRDAGANAAVTEESP